MALKTIRVRIKEWEEGLDEAIKAMKDIKASRRPKKKSGTCFQDLEAARAVLTETRLSLLRLIREKEPESIAELARLAKRDFKSVHGDVELLKDLGLVKVSKALPGLSNALSSDTTEIVFRIAV